MPFEREKYSALGLKDLCKNIPEAKTNVELRAQSLADSELRFGRAPEADACKLYAKHLSAASKAELLHQSRKEQALLELKKVPTFNRLSEAEQKNYANLFCRRVTNEKLGVALENAKAAFKDPRFEKLLQAGERTRNAILTRVDSVQDLDRIYVYVDKFRSNQQLANLGKSQKDVILASIVRTTDYYCKLNNVESQKLTEFFDSDLRWFTNYGARFNGLDDKVKNALLRSGSGIMSMGRGCSPASISGYFDRITNGDFSGRKDSAPPAQIFDALSNLDVQNLDQKLVNRSIATLLDYERLRSKEQFSIAASYLGSLFSQPKFHSLSDNLKGDLISLAGLEPILRSPSDINVVKFLSDLAHDKDFWNIDPTKIELLVDKFRAIAFLGKKKGGYSDDNAGWKLGQPADVIDSKSMDILGYAVNYKKEPLMARLEELLADRWPKLRNPEFIPDQFSEYFKLTTNEKFQRVRIGNNVSLSVGGGAPSVDSFTEVVHFSDGHSIMMALPKDHSWNKEEETDLPSVQMILSRIAEAPKDYRHALRYVVVEPNSKLSFSDTGTKTAMLADLEKSQLEIFPLPTNEHGAFTFSTEMAIWHELAHLATLTGPKQFTRRDFAEWRKAIKDDRASVSKYSAEATKESQGYDPIFEDIADAGAIYAAASLQQTDKLYKVAKFLYGNRLRILERKYGQLKFSTPVEKESDE